MKKLLLVCIVFMIIPFVVGVRINEVMADPDICSDSDCEYVELYSNESINLTNWIINDGANNKTFNFTIIDYLIITRNKTCFMDNYVVDENKTIEISMSLRNSDDSILIFDNNSQLMSNYTYDESHSGISWQFCSGNWTENPPTPGRENNCSVSGDGNESEGGNESGNETDDGNDDENNDNGNEEPETYLEIDWDEDEIFNKGNFSIDVEVYFLEGKGNLKIWVEEDGDVISDRYDKENEEWASGRFYVDEFFDEENESREILLRMRDEDYGEFEICYKLEDVVDEECEDIEVLEKNETEESEDSQIKEVRELIEKNEEENESSRITGKVISLGGKSEDIKTPENLIYESKTEKIKKYSVFGFAILCLVLCVMMIMKKL